MRRVDRFNVSFYVFFFLWFIYLIIHVIECLSCFCIKGEIELSGDAVCERTTAFVMI